MTKIENKVDIEVCEVPRWIQIKHTLENLNYEDFLKVVQEDENCVILDVRTAAEFELENIPNAINLDYLSRDLADQLEKLDPNKNYYIYCRTGRRSLRVCVILRNLGFQKVTNLDGGIVSK